MKAQVRHASLRNESRLKSQTSIFHGFSFQTDSIFEADGNAIQPLVSKMEEFFSDKWAQVLLFMNNSGSSGGEEATQQIPTGT